MLGYAVLLCCTALRCAVLCYAVLCCAVLCCASLPAHSTPLGLCCAVLCCTVQSEAFLPSSTHRKPWGKGWFCKLPAVFFLIMQPA